MSRRHDPYAEIKQRLDDWGHYAPFGGPALGWNVSTIDLDAEVPRGIQKRNDVKSDPTGLEVMRMDREKKRYLQTDNALRELRPRSIRELVRTKHRDYPDASDAELARKTQWEQRHIGRDLRFAYEALTEIVDGMQHQRFNARKSVASYRKTVAF